MSTTLMSLNSEIDSINDVEIAAKNTFQHCNDMIKDILRHNPDSNGDLMRLKAYMTSISESQREIAGLIHGVNEMSNLTDKVNLSEDQVTAKFQEILDEFTEENEIDDDQKNLLFSLDNFLEGEVETGTQKEGGDVQVTKTTVSYKDPLTQRLMKVPVKSQLCKHTYEKDSIMSYLGDSKKKCPYSGCQSKLSRKDLIDDLVLKLKLSMKQEDASEVS